MSDIREKIITILINSGLFNGNISEIDDECYKNIIEEIDSLDLINLIVNIENTFDIELPDEFMNKNIFSTMDRLCACISELKE